MEEFFSVVRGSTTPLCIFCSFTTVIAGFEGGNFLGKLFAKKTLNRFEEKRFKLYSKVMILFSVIFIMLCIYATLYDNAPWGKGVFLPLGIHLGTTAVFVAISSRRVT